MRFLLDEFRSPSTCWWRLQQWEDERVWLDAWCALLGALDAEGLLRWDETLLDGSHCSGEKRGEAVGNRGGKARSEWTGHRSRSSAAILLASASPGELRSGSQLAKSAYHARWDARVRSPRRVIADRG